MIYIKESAHTALAAAFITIVGLIQCEKAVEIATSLPLLASFPFAGYPKPRMTQRDKWRNPPRNCVGIYRRFADNLRIFAANQRFVMPQCEYWLLFLFACPHSWSKKKQAAHHGKPHQTKPDKDNLEKAVLDALLADDASVWDGRVTKLWFPRDEIRIYRTGPPWDSAHATGGSDEYD